MTAEPRLDDPAWCDSEEGQRYLTRDWPKEFRAARKRERQAERRPRKAASGEQ